MFSLCCPTSMVAEAAAAGHAAGLAVGQVRTWDRCVSLSDDSEGGRSVQLQWLSAAAPAWGPDVAAGVYRFRQDRSFRLPGILQPAAPTGSGAAAEPVLQSSLVGLGSVSPGLGSEAAAGARPGAGVGAGAAALAEATAAEERGECGRGQGGGGGSCLLLLHCSVPSTFTSLQICADRLSTEWTRSGVSRSTGEGRATTCGKVCHQWVEHDGITTCIADGNVCGLRQLALAHTLIDPSGNAITIAMPRDTGVPPHQYNTQHITLTQADWAAVALGPWST